MVNYSAVVRVFNRGGMVGKREFSTKVRQLLLDYIAANDLDRWEVCTLFSLSSV